MATYCFDTKEAELYGVDEAIMVHHVRYWITRNNLNKENEHDDRTWTYNSNEAFTGLFPFWKPHQIRRILKSLVDKEILISGNYNKQKFDRTKWYAFKNEEKHLKLPQNGPDITENSTGDSSQDDLREMSNGVEKNVNAIPYSKQQIVNTDSKPDIPPIVHQGKAETEKEICKRIIGHLNLKTGRSYKPVAANNKHITARFKEGHTEADIIAVIDMKTREWLSDPKMSGYLRPETLFNASKFNSYVGQIGIAPTLTEEEKTAAWINGIDSTNNVFDGVFTREA